MSYLYETVPVGSFWGHKAYGSVYKVISKWPSLGGTTHAEITLRHIRTGEVYTRTYRAMCDVGLKQLDPEDVPMALLGDV